MKKWIHPSGRKLNRFIQASKYLDPNDESIVFDDKIVIDVEIDLPLEIFSATTDLIKFPGLEKFKQDVLNILENEYGFDVIEDIYDGRKQKGHLSNRKDSVSLYFDTFYDLSKTAELLKRGRIENIEPLSGYKIFCFIHFRFSDHDLHDQGDVLHRQWLKQNTAKYAANRQDLAHVEDEEIIQVNENTLYRAYEQALDDLRFEIDIRIVGWLRKARRYIDAGVNNIH